MTESYKQTEGEAPILRKAKAFKHVCEHMPLLYSKYQLLLGDPSAHFLGGEVEPEFFTTWLEKDVFVEEANETMGELEALKLRGVEAWVISDEDIKALKEDILPYWREICHPNIVQKQLEDNFPYVNFKDGHFLGKTSHPLFGWGVSHTIADYTSVLQKGLKGLKEEIYAEMEKIDASDIPSNAEFDRVNCYKAMLIAASAINIYGNRCADLAVEMAAKGSLWLYALYFLRLYYGFPGFFFISSNIIDGIYATSLIIPLSGN